METVRGAERSAAVLRPGGRPTRQQAAQLGEKILEVATGLFLTRGFGATSIEAVAERARISKRTFYHRFADKADLFRAVVHRLLARWLPRFEAEFYEAAPLDELLRRLAGQILAVALTPEALALRRMLLAEAQRFPELMTIMNEQGAARGIELITGLLKREAGAGRVALDDPHFAAEQFLQMVLAVPQRRAMGFGVKMTSAELESWADRSVALFLFGCRYTSG
jgi:TetR/AcrR family transcriptional regulator, mexJK operon transcriptional repressor